MILQMPLQFYVQKIISAFTELEIRKRMHFEDLVFNYKPFLFTLIFRFTLFFYLHEVYTLLHNMFKGSDQRKNRWVWSNVNTRYLVWRCGDGGSFAL